MSKKDILINDMYFLDVFKNDVFFFGHVYFRQGEKIINPSVFSKNCIIEFDPNKKYSEFSFQLSQLLRSPF